MTMLVLDIQMDEHQRLLYAIARLAGDLRSKFQRFTASGS
jgi:hypothetical protein